MKNLIIIIASIVTAQCLFAQSSYFELGGGFLPHSVHEPVKQFTYYNGLYELYENDLNQGYNLYLGFGGRHLLGERWSINPYWLFAHFQYPIKQTLTTRFGGSSGEIIFRNNGSGSHQLEVWQLGLSVHRTFDVGRIEIETFGGVYLGFKFMSWSKREGNSLTYSEVGSQLVFDSSCQCEKQVYLITNRYDTPLTGSYSGEGDENRLNQDSYFGVNGGVNFPLFAGSEGSMRGQIMVLQDFTPYFQRNSTYHSRFSQTAIMAGLVFLPEGQYSNSYSYNHKRLLSNGIYLGFSSYDVLIVSADGGWHSNNRFGFDFSMRYVIIFKSASVSFGPKYQIGDSRFFVKAGGEYYWTPDRDEDNIGESGLDFYGGFQYVLPLWDRVGLHFDVGLNSRIPVIGFGTMFMLSE